MGKKLTKEEMEKMQKIAESQKSSREAMRQINAILTKYNLKIVVNHTVELRKNK